MTVYTSYPDEDSYTSNTSPSTNYGSKTQIRALKSGSTYNYAYIQFDITGINIDDVTACTLRLYAKAMEDPSNMRIYRLTSTFDESTITYNNAPSYDSGTYVSAQFGDTNPDQQSINTLTLLQNETGNTFGVRIACIDSGTYTGGSFGSKESTLGSAHYPMLSITYETIPDPTTDWYVVDGGTGIANGYDWDNAMATVNEAMTSVTNGNTVHIAFGTYTDEPANNTLSPDADDVTVIYETADTGGGSGTATIEVN